MSEPTKQTVPSFPQVTMEETRKASKHWSAGGVKLILDDVHIRFACEWANLVLKNFVLMCAQQAKAAQAGAPNTPPVGTTQAANSAPEKKSSIVLTD